MQQESTSGEQKHLRLPRNIQWRGVGSGWWKNRAECFDSKWDGSSMHFNWTQSCSRIDSHWLTQVIVKYSGILQVPLVAWNCPQLEISTPQKLANGTDQGSSSSSSPSSSPMLTGKHLLAHHWLDSTSWKTSELGQIFGSHNQLLLFSFPGKQRMQLILQNLEAFAKCFEMQCLFVLPFKFPNDVFLKLVLKSSFIWGHILQRTYFELQKKLVQNLKHHIELGYKRMCSVSKWSRIVFIFIYTDKYFIIFCDPIVIELLTIILRHW